MQHSTTTITYNLQIYDLHFCNRYSQYLVSLPQPEFIVVSYIVTSGIRAKKGDLPIIQRRLIVTSSDILYKLWIPCREGDQYLLYLLSQHNIPSFICANEGESVVVYPNISSVILRDEPEIHAYHTNLHSNGYQHQQSIVEAKQSQSTSISNETSVSGYLTNYPHDRYCPSASDQHTSNLHSSNHTSVWNREDTLVLTRPQTSVCEGEHSNIIIHSVNEGDNAHATPFIISSANPNIDQRDASSASASTSSHHLCIIGYVILATLIVVLTTPIVHVCMDIMQKILYAATVASTHQIFRIGWPPTNNQGGVSHHFMSAAKFLHKSRQIAKLRDFPLFPGIS